MLVLSAITFINNDIGVKFTSLSKTQSFDYELAIDLYKLHLIVKANITEISRPYKKMDTCPVLIHFQKIDAFFSSSNAQVRPCDD